VMRGDAADTDEATSSEENRARTDFMASAPAERKTPILGRATDY